MNPDSDHALAGDAEISTRPLAILGGTFDPVHLGHLRSAWEASEVLDAEVRLLPCHVPPHRERPVASVEQRVAMLRAALSGQGRLALDTRELRRSGPSYSIDTLLEIRASIGSDRPLVLLLGADAFAGLPNWHRWRELFNHAHIGVLARAGHDPELPDSLQHEISNRVREQVMDLRSKAAGYVARVPVTALEISSSGIRALLAQRRQPRYLLSDAVLNEHKLLAPYLPTEA